MRGRQEHKLMKKNASPERGNKGLIADVHTKSKQYTNDDLTWDNSRFYFPHLRRVMRNYETYNSIIQS